MNDTPTARAPVTDTIYETIREFRLTNMRDEDGCDYPLVDAMTRNGRSIADGEEQMRDLAYAISQALAAAPPPPAIIGGDSPSEREKALREALETFQSYGCPACGGDCASANPPVYCCPLQEARAALLATPAEGGGT